MKTQKMMLGYIRKVDLDLNPQATERFKLLMAPYTRSISSRSDKVKCKLFSTSFDYEDVASTTEILKENPKLMIVREPFFLDDELLERVNKWVDWANQADPSEYDPFYQKETEHE